VPTVLRVARAQPVAADPVSRGVNRDGRLSRYIMIAWGLWAASWFLPAAGIRADGGVLRRDATFAGWEIVLMILSDPPHALHDAGRLAAWLMVLTNLIMLASPLADLTERPKVRRLFKLLATSAAHLNVFGALPHLGFLWYGYLVWWASFILLAWALWQDRAPTRRT
jgi:hypothetical protein